MIEIDGKPVDPHFPPLIVAEACNNFLGKMSVAKRLIDQANQAGCDAVKFQMRLQPDRITPDQHRELQEYCYDQEISYFATAFDKQGVDILHEMNVPAIKIGSGQCLDMELIRYAGSTALPLIISTGGTDFNQVTQIAQYADVLLHTVSAYPTPDRLLNLMMIPYYATQFQNTPIGYSCHHPTIYPAIAACAKGACMVEKHFTTDKTNGGVDAIVSANYDEMRTVVEASKIIFAGDGMERGYFDEEKEKLEAVR